MAAAVSGAIATLSGGFGVARVRLCRSARCRLDQGQHPSPSAARCRRQNEALARELAATQSQLAGTSPKPRPVRPRAAEWRRRGSEQRAWALCAPAGHKPFDLAQAASQSLARKQPGTAGCDGSSPAHFCDWRTARKRRRDCRRPSVADRRRGVRRRAPEAVCSLGSLFDHHSRLPRDGRFVRLEAPTRSLLLTRDEEGRLRALRNLCLHAGYPVCEAVEGASERLACPYHGWEYTAAGRLVEPDLSHRMAPERLHLQSHPVSVQDGLIFVDLSRSAFAAEEPVIPANRTCCRTGWRTPRSPADALQYRVELEAGARIFCNLRRS